MNRQDVQGARNLAPGGPDNQQQLLNPSALLAPWRFEFFIGL